MKKSLIFVFVLYSTNIFACWDMGSSEYWFYNLFEQTNISSEAYYPFLREDGVVFYGSNDFYEVVATTDGNVLLWQKLLKNWGLDEIEKAIYKPTEFSWQNKNTAIEKNAKNYIEFAQLCSSAFTSQNTKSWDYEEIRQHKTFNASELLSKANELLNNESNNQLKIRYYYQIIRILRYSNDWAEAIKLYEKIKDKLPQDEIYYYIIDQIAGCYYSMEEYEKAAYIFLKVFNESIDRKKSAYLSYNFCTNQGADGKSFFNDIEDEKDFLLITSLRDFSDEIRNINKFIELDANDPRLELLFMRAVNNVEREVWPKNIGVSDKTLPCYENETKRKELLSIAERQINNNSVQNKDFWRLSSSYLSFINNDIETAKNKLSKVNSYADQKKTLQTIYKVSEWSRISSDNEKYIYNVLKDNPPVNDRTSSENDFRNFILDKMGHIYYKNNQIAKAFLVLNNVENVKNIHSLKLLNALEKLYNKANKNDFEKWLIKNDNEYSFIDYVNYRKGIYYLYDKNPEKALVYFNKNKNYKAEKLIHNTIFSNNIKECFQCPEDKMMTDEIYKNNLFSFIKAEFTAKELTTYLIKLQELASNKDNEKAKLANYLLGNYYFNISNTGYHRGLLTDNTNVGNYYLSQGKTGEEIIANKTGYNLYDIWYYEKNYFNLSATAIKYYQKAVDLSDNPELNAKCTYLMAKCELNNYYNNPTKGNTYVVLLDDDYEMELFDNKYFKLLKNKYSNTEYHSMIIKECSYFRHYSNNN